MFMHFNNKDCKKRRGRGREKSGEQILLSTPFTELSMKKKIELPVIYYSEKQIRKGINIFLSQCLSNTSN